MDLEETVVVQPGCGTNGKMKHTCTVCGCVYYTEIIKTGQHVASEDWTVINEATCVSKGWQVKYCTTCNEIVESFCFC